MRKILFILFLIPSVLFGQRFAFPSTAHLGSGGEEPGGEYTTQYQAVLDAMTVDPAGDTLTWFNDYTYTLDTAGIWDILDVLLVFGTRNSQGALLNWIVPSGTAATSSSAVFAPYSGYDFNGSSQYINTNWNPTDDGTNYILNDASIAVYSLDVTTIAGFDIGGGTAANSTDASVASLAFSTGYTYNRINSDNLLQSQDGSQNSGAFFIFQRTGANATNIYRNNTATDNGGNPASNTLTADDFYIGAVNENGSAAYYTNREIFMVSFGGSFTSGQRASFNTATETLADHFGIGVQ